MDGIQVGQLEIELRVDASVTTLIGWNALYLFSTSRPSLGIFLYFGNGGT